MSALEGFLTGFMTTTADNINKRKDEADAYFQSQMELAHKVGLQNHQKRQELMRGGLQTAEKLLQAGVPKNVVMSVANQNPDDLETLYDETVKLQRSGAKLTPEVWSELVEVKGEIDPDISMQEFFSRVYGPIKREMEADPEGFKYDPKGSVWSTLMGHNAMDRARGRLDSTEVVDGLSASEVLSSSTAPNRPFDASASFSHEMAGDLGRKQDEYWSPDALVRFRGQFDDLVEEAATNWKRQNETINITPDVMEELRYQVGAEMATWGIEPDRLSQLGPGFGKYFIPREEDNLAEEGVEVMDRLGSPLPSPEASDPLSIPPTTPTASVPRAEPSPSVPSDPITQLLDDAPIVLEEEANLSQLPDGEIFLRDNGDGTSVYLTLEGEEVIIENKDAREVSRRGRSYFEPTPTPSLPMRHTEESAEEVEDSPLAPDSLESIREGNRLQREKRNKRRSERNRRRGN